MTTRPLENILAGGSDSAPSGEQKPDQQSQPTAPAAAEQQPAATGQQQQPPGQQQDDDDPERQAVDVQGQKMVPIGVVQAERGKAKRYTEQVAAFDKKFADQQKAFDDYRTAQDRRFSELIMALQPRQQAQPQPPAAQPDFYADPDAAIRAAIEQHLAPVVTHIGKMSEATSQRFAVRDHGKETVDAAYDALQKMFDANPRAAQAEKQRIMGSGDPWGELVNWHKTQTAVAEFGTDPAAYREKLKAELLAELKAQTQQPQGSAGQQPPPASAAAPVMPSNLATARNAGPRSGPAWAGPSSLNDIFDRRNKRAS